MLKKLLTIILGVAFLLPLIPVTALAACFPVAVGGTGWCNIVANSILLGNGTSPLATTSAGTNGQFLSLVAGVPTWANVTVGGATSTNPFMATYFVSTSTSATSTFAFGLQATKLNITDTTASSTFANGIQLSSGCFQLPSGTCLSSSASTNPAGSGTELQYRANATTFGAVTSSAFDGTHLSLATTTAASGVLTIGTSTAPQLLLSDNTAADNLWTLRSISNSLFIATSTATATSSVAAMSISSGGVVTIPNILKPAGFTISGTTLNAGDTISLTSKLKVFGGDYLDIGLAGFGISFSTTNGAGGVFAGWNAGSSTFASGFVVGWSNVAFGSAFNNAPVDTGLSRLAANKLALGNGNTGNTSGTFVAGNIGVGSTTPWGNLSVAGISNGTAPLFTVSTSTASATSTAFIIDQNGLIGISTSTPGSLLSIGGIGNLTTATSTFYSTGGLNIQSGCFAVNNVCLSSSAGTNFWTQTGNTIYNSTGAFVQIATSTPSNALLGITASSTSFNSFLIQTATSTVSQTTVTFTSNGTWTVPSNLTSAIITVIGAGGGGGSFQRAPGGGGGSTAVGALICATAGGGASDSGSTNSGNISSGRGGDGSGGTGGTDPGSGGSAGGAGGGGAQAVNTYSKASLASSYSITIGAGGGPGTSGSSAGAGGAGAFTGGTGDAVDGSGGGGGGCTGNGANGTAGGGGAGGTGATSATATSGNNGGFQSGTTGGTGGNSGSAAAGGAGGTVGNAGSVGANYGAGGGGGSSTHESGGAGAPGEVVIVESLTTVSSVASTTALVVGNVTTGTAANSTTTPAVGVGTSTPSATFSVQGFGFQIVQMISSIIGATQYIFQEIDSVGHMITGGPAPTCGAGCSSIQGDDKNMRILTGSTVTTVVANFANSWGKTPDCIANEESVGTVSTDASSTPTSVTVTTASALTSKFIVVHCEISNNFTF